MAIIMGGVLFLIYFMIKSRTKGGKISNVIFRKGDADEYRRMNDNFIKLMIFLSFSQNLNNRQVSNNFINNSEDNTEDSEISTIEREEKKMLELLRDDAEKKKDEK